MSGAGNDFICIDNRRKKIKLTQRQIERLCHRQQGIGADGLLMLEPSKNKMADYTMRYYNADGKEAEMCGNGARCLARFACKVTGTSKRTLILHTRAGLIEASAHGEEISLKMTQPKETKLHQIIQTSQGKIELHFINTGVPHLVIFTNKLESVPLSQLGPFLRYHKVFAPAGTNVNWVQIENKTKAGAVNKAKAKISNKLSIRTYERGVEAETLACGTGAVASALIAHMLYKLSSPIDIRVAGGDVLRIQFEKGPAGDFEKVSLQGPAEFIFEGEINPKYF